MVFSKFDLSGKACLITGGAGLLGRQHACALLECGATVILTDTSITALDETFETLSLIYESSRILTMYMDVTESSSISRVVSSLSKKSIRVDILINNAAIDPKVNVDMGLLESSRLENFDLDSWNVQLSVGLTGAFLCSKVFGTLMSSDGAGGVILNIASDLSVIAPDQRLYQQHGLPDHMQPVKPVTYSVIKTGLIGLTRYLATYWADKGIRCNALSPGGVFNGQPSAFVSRLSSLVPLNRMADVDEYRSAVQFLCSDASAYMNGQNIVMDGGRSVL